MKISSYVYRNDVILEHCRGKRVLHLGCVGFTDCATEDKIANAKRSLHAKVSEIADCEGVDLDDVAVRELRDAGIFDNVVVGNVEHLDEAPLKGGEYDIVLAGDIIEHVSNPGLMLDGIRRRLAPTGELIVSTPNAFSGPAWLRFLRGRFREGAQHVLCFNEITLRQLLERHGYEVVSAQTCFQEHSLEEGGPAFRLFRRVLEAAPRFGGTLLYRCRKRGA